MTPNELKKLGEQGFIPGPEESEEVFVKRIDSPAPTQSFAAFPSALSFMEEKIGLVPSWIEIRYSKKHLSPWEGAALLTEKSDEGIYRASIQLRDGFKKGRFLLYDRDEVIVHEAIHALRIGFDEPRFEEMMAYHFSKSSLRRYLGPLFSTPKQAYLFLGTMLLSLLTPMIMLVYLIIRGSLLVRNHRIFRKAFRRIRKCFPEYSPYQMLLRLTDKEIELFANQNEEAIMAYVDEQKTHSAGGSFKKQPPKLSIIVIDRLTFKYYLY